MGRCEIFPTLGIGIMGGSSPAKRARKKTIPTKAKRLKRKPSKIVTPAAVGGLARGQRRYGLGAWIVVVEGLGSRQEVKRGQLAMFGRTARQGGVMAMAQMARKVARKVDVEALSGILGAVGNPHRLRILLELLAGPTTYQGMKDTIGLKAGPFYHHINHLRLAGLISGKSRDLYMLTKSGRNVILASIAMSDLTNDPAPRSLPK